MSSNRIRHCGLAAMVGGILGILYAPFYALAYFDTADGAESLEAPWVAAWAGAVRPALEPLLTFAPPEAVYLTYTMFEDDATVFTAMRDGAKSYVLKDDDKDDVLGAIRTVGRGGAVFGPGVAIRLTDFLTTARPPLLGRASPTSRIASVRCCI